MLRGDSAVVLASFWILIMVSDMSSAGSMWPLEAIRRQFSGLARVQNGMPAAIFDGPAGSQVPECVVDAVCQYLRRTNCNRGAAFATARESDRILTEAHQCVADFLGADDPDCVIFGPKADLIEDNDLMTSDLSYSFFKRSFDRYCCRLTPLSIENVTNCN